MKQLWRVSFVASLAPVRSHHTAILRYVFVVSDKLFQNLQPSFPSLVWLRRYRMVNMNTQDEINLAEIFGLPSIALGRSDNIATFRYFLIELNALFPDL